ncbi:MAG: hypothetical protein AMJ81_04680 [Phycisphaerae bacterium SM23_33]|nr:MAG: hypothetical protein AMJ81_04680 [Phycisphaerae bacterium SM23_33]
MMVWYARALRRHPAGLVSQAQAAAMLAVSRMTISRLVAGGHLRAVHFPRPPDIAGLAVGRRDPEWLRLAAWLGVDPEEADVAGFSKACYVSFADVLRLWRSSRAADESRRHWEDILAELGAAPPAGTAPQTPPAEPPETPSKQELETWML